MQERNLVWGSGFLPAFFSVLVSLESEGEFKRVKRTEKINFSLLFSLLFASNARVGVGRG